MFQKSICHLYYNYFLRFKKENISNYLIKHQKIVFNIQNIKRETAIN